jgi:hypothetical protein
MRTVHVDKINKRNLATCNAQVFSRHSYSKSRRRHGRVGGNHVHQSHRYYNSSILCALSIWTRCWRIQLLVMSKFSLALLQTSRWKEPLNLLVQCRFRWLSVLYFAGIEIDWGAILHPLAHRDTEKMATVLNIMSSPGLGCERSTRQEACHEVQRHAD